MDGAGAMFYEASGKVLFNGTFSQGPYTYDVPRGGGETKNKTLVLISCVSVTGEGSKSGNFVDVIYGLQGQLPHGQDLRRLGQRRRDSERYRDELR